MDSKDYKINALTQQIANLYQRQEFDEAAKSISLLCEIDSGSFECQYARFYDTIIREISRAYFGPQAKQSVVKNYLGRLDQKVSSLYATYNLDTLFQKLDLYTKSFFVANKFISNADVRVALFEAIQSAKTDENKNKIVNVIINFSRDVYALPTVHDNINVITDFTKLLSELLLRSSLEKSPYLEKIGTTLLDQLNKMIEFTMSTSLLNNYLIVYESVHQLTSKKIKYPDVEKLRTEYDRAREEENNFQILEKEFKALKIYYSNNLLTLDKIGDYEIHTKRTVKLTNFVKKYNELSPKIKNFDLAEITKAHAAIVEIIPKLDEKVKKVSRELLEKKNKRIKRTILVFTMLILATISGFTYDHFRMNVTFTLNQGQWESNPPSTRHFSIENLIALEPTRDGFAFDGWYLNSSLTQAATQETINRREAVELYAKWRILSYRITYNTNGGNTISSREVEFSSPIQSQPTPVRTGYQFDGWFTDEGLTQRFNQARMPSENLTLNAKWSILSYQLTFYSENRTSIISRSNIEFDSPIIIPNPPAREGFTFNRFNICDTNTEITLSLRMPSRNLDACALYTRNNYTLSFRNGLQTTTQSVPFEQTPTLITPAPRPGFVFRGWYETSTFSRAYVRGPMPARNLTLYAKWSEIFELTIELNGGVGETSYQVAHEDPIRIETPTREGFFFGGYYLDSAFETPFEGEFMPDENLTLYVEWLPARVLTFSGPIPGEIVTQTYQFPGSISIDDIPIPQLEHYQFSGYFSNFFLTNPIAPGTIYDRSATIYVRWIPIEYSLSFVTNGGNTISAINVPYRGSISSALPSNPTRDGFNFTGWYTDLALTEAFSSSMTMPGNNLVLYANWERDPSLDGSSFDLAIVLESESSLPGRVNTGGQQIYYRFTPQTSGIYIFTTTGTSNTVGRLYNEQRNQLTFTSTGGTGNNFRISRTLVAGTTYYLQVSLSLSSSVGNYLVVVQPQN